MTQRRAGSNNPKYPLSQNYSDSRKISSRQRYTEEPIIRRDQSLSRSQSNAKSRARARAAAKRRKKIIISRIIACSLLLICIILIIVLAVRCSKNKDNNPSETGSNKQHNEQQSTGSKDKPKESEAKPVDYDDTEPPELSGPKTIYVNVGSTVAYKSYIQVTDDWDDDPTIKVNADDVNLAKPGTYFVEYTAIDASGNYSTKEISVEVEDNGYENVEEDVIYDYVNSILFGDGDKDEPNGIIQPWMSDLQKVFRIFYYVRDTFEYVPDSSYMEYKQEAYKFLMTYKDNCYANVCLSQLMLECCGFQSYLAEGPMSENFGDGGEEHYWNMVSIDGGQNWYRYDAAWWSWMYSEYPMCMMTDDFAQEISQRHAGIYPKASANYPATPKEDLWTPDTMDALGLNKNDLN